MMSLGAFFAFLAALTFGISDASARRGVVTGSAFDAVIISMPIGTLLFFMAALATGQLFRFQELSHMALLNLALAGLVHFIWGRYWNFKALQALGSNLAAPISQMGILITLGLALIVLREQMTFMVVIGVTLLILGPIIVLREASQSKTQALDFRPRLVQGYLAAIFSALGFGISPILIRLALESSALAVLGGLVSYLAALLVLLLLLLTQGRLGSSLQAINMHDTRWFIFAGTGIALSQLFRFVALGLAPVVIVAPLIRLSLIIRIVASTLMNRNYEVISWLIIVGAVVSLLGGIILVLT